MVTSWIAQNMGISKDSSFCVSSYLTILLFSRQVESCFTIAALTSVLIRFISNHCTTTSPKGSASC